MWASQEWPIQFHFELPNIFLVIFIHGLGLIVYTTPYTFFFSCRKLILMPQVQWCGCVRRRVIRAIHNSLYSYPFWPGLVTIFLKPATECSHPTKTLFGTHIPYIGFIKTKGCSYIFASTKNSWCGNQLFVCKQMLLAANVIHIQMMIFLAQMPPVYILYNHY